MDPAPHEFALGGTVLSPGLGDLCLLKNIVSSLLVAYPEVSCAALFYKVSVEVAAISRLSWIFRPSRNRSFLHFMKSG